MTKWRVRRSMFGWWKAYRPDETLGLIDSHTYVRAWTEARLLRKLDELERPKADKWYEYESVDDASDSAGGASESAHEASRSPGSLSEGKDP